MAKTLKSGATPPAKPAKDIPKSSKQWDLSEDNVVTITEGDEVTEVATLEYPESDPDQTGPANIHWASDDAKETYGQQLITFLTDEEIKFNNDTQTTADQDEDEKDAIARENDPEWVKKNKIPPAPRQDIYRGDKSPKYVEWLQKYKPATYKAKYGIIGPGKVTKTREIIDPETNRPKTVTYEVDAILARRKTHLTELAHAGVESEGEEDVNPFLKE